jgi:hypothetical protein
MHRPSQKNYTILSVDLEASFFNQFCLARGVGGTLEFWPRYVTSKDHSPYTRISSPQLEVRLGY